MCFLDSFSVLLDFFCCSQIFRNIFCFVIFLDFLLVSVVSSTRFNGGVLLGPLPIVPSASLASVPNSHLCASSLVSVVPLVIHTCLSFSANLAIPYVCSVH